MRAQMSATAWEAGIRNATLVGIIVMSLLMLLAFAISFITHQSFWDAAESGFLIFWCGILLLLLVSLQRDWSARGPVELDCGHRPMRWLFILNAVLFFLMALTGGMFNWLIMSNVLRVGFSLTFVLFYLFMAFGRLQICAEGIWQYNGLLRWRQIKSYQWKESTLVIVVNSKLPFLGRGALPIPAECMAVVDAILHRQLDETHSSETDED